MTRTFRPFIAARSGTGFIDARLRAYTAPQPSPTMLYLGSTSSRRSPTGPCMMRLASS
ncbi:Uncharacterised protein [Bordetella pertussis]|nr:Uncharacterised protein [Bordetella pertussis]